MALHSRTLVLLKLGDGVAEKCYYQLLQGQRHQRINSTWQELEVKHNYENDTTKLQSWMFMSLCKAFSALAGKMRHMQSSLSFPLYKQDLSIWCANTFRFPQHKNTQFLHFSCCLRILYLWVSSIVPRKATVVDNKQITDLYRDWRSEKLNNRTQSALPLILDQL